MRIKTIRFITVLIAALALGMKLAHVFELPPKLTYDADLYLTIQTSLYTVFGMIGPFLEVGTLIGATTLTILLRQRKTSFRYTLITSVLVLISLIIWVVFVRAANTHINEWQQSGITPSDWQQWRDQWQYGQAATFVLHLIGFGSLILSILNDEDRA